MEKILYINAGAGSGKTYRLTHELPTYLCDEDAEKRVKPSEVIVTTFTIAAAEEIRERSRKVLLEKDRTDEAAQLDTAAIGTIHSVCQQFIRKYWYAIGMAPESDVLSEADKKIYRNQSIGKLIESGRYAKEREVIDRYYHEFKPKEKDANEIPVDDPDFWTKMLDQMVGKISYYDISAEGVEESIQASKEEVAALFTVDVAPDANRYKEMLKEAKNVVKTFVESQDAPVKTYEDNWAKLRKVSDTLTYANLQSAFSYINSFLKKLPELEETCKVFGTWLQSKVYGELVTDLIDALFTLAQAWQKEYEIYKKSHCVIDFDDMERGMLALLENKEIYDEIGRNYKLVMVDEFQDCNPIQLRIFNKLSEAVAKYSPLAQSSIWVGDPKQAIYSFRGSNTDLINRVAKKFPKEIKVADAHGLMRDELGTSFRSRKPLVELANKAFHREGLFPDMVELAHNEEQNPEYAEYKPAVRHLQFLDKYNPEYYLNLARYIKEMVESGKYMIRPKDEKELRPLDYGDIALLVRSNGAANGIAHEMMCAGVPVFVPESAITERTEVQLVLSLMRLTEKQNPSVQAHETASLLKLWCDKDTEEVLADRINFYATAPLNEEGYVIETWKDNFPELAPLFLAIESVKEKTFDKRVTDLILLLSLNDKVAKWGEADVRRNNLLTLQKAAVAFSQRCDNLGIEKTTAEFVTYLQETELDTTKSIVPGAVIVKTYHGSKGLEWPMVMLLSLDSDHTTDSKVKEKFFGVNEQMCDDDSDAIIPSYRLIVFPNFMGLSFTDCFKDKTMALPRFEETRIAERKDATRLMYVGLTRAREYAFTVTDGKELKMPWLKAIGIKEYDKKIEDNDLWSTGNDIEIEQVAAIIEPYPTKPKLSSSKKQEKIDENNRLLAEWEAQKRKVDERNAKEAHCHEVPLGTYQLQDIAPLCDDGYVELMVKPSKLMMENCNATFNKYVIEGVHFFPKKSGKGEEAYAAMGTCIHNAFAAYNPKATDEQSLKMIQTVIRLHGFEDSLEADKLVKSISELYHWLTSKYGDGTARHEVPFKQYRTDGTLVSGEMDLLWQTDKGVVLVDFKNFIAADKETVLDPANPKHYVGRYVPQLTAYRDALTTSGMNVLTSLIYYSTMGVIIEIA